MAWIFGYGSLIWRPAFAFDEQRKAALHGWRRRFWQASPDHRGLPGAPGRVVTLVAEQYAVCWGLAFKPPRALWSTVIADLDYRERNGYARTDIELEFETGERVAAVTYIAGADNPSFVGPAPVAAILAQVATAHGPSGSNREYVLQLAEHLTGLGVHDAEVHELAQALAAM